MAVSKARILTTGRLIQQIIESNRNGERFCFILGSGASVESGIPTGGSLEMRWMNCLMGKAEDLGTPAMDADDVRTSAANLYEDGMIEHKFEDIEAAWKYARENNELISSAYYFDIYKLRFYPNQRNGYRYLERIMESQEPSLGYHTLALMLTGDKRNNLVITTNFDSLVEDALFLYTNKKPLIVSHESLTGYIESDIQRPIIAKVHRGLMYAPFNSPETTKKLKGEWKEALNYAFSTYTPIVIGYGGGDRSLMSFLEEESTSMRHGVYWCYMEDSGLPDENIQDFVEKKNGFFVSIRGFDALMMEIGNALYHNEITPTRTEDYLKNQYEQRVEQYNTQWDKLNEKPELKQVLQPMNASEQSGEERREKEHALTAWDYIRRGTRANDEGRHEEAIAEYTKAIELNPDNSTTYNRRGFAYDDLCQYEKAIEDYNKAIELNPGYAVAYNNRGFAYKNLEQYERAIEDYSKAIELDPSYARAYNNRGRAYTNLKQYEKAIEDYNKAIELDSDYAIAYSNRGVAYNDLKQYEKAIEDYNRAIELYPDYAIAYNNRGFTYKNLKQYEKAIEDYSKAIELNPNYKIAYSNRAEVYRVISEDALAEADEKCAKTL